MKPTGFYMLLGIICLCWNYSIARKAPLKIHAHSSGTSGHEDEYIVVKRDASLLAAEVGESLATALTKLGLDMEVKNEFTIGKIRLVVVRPRHASVLETLRELDFVDFIESNGRMSIIPILDTEDQDSENVPLSSMSDGSKEIPWTTGNVHGHSQEYEKCTTKYLDERLWGLSRVHARSKPESYSGSSYAYSNVDDGSGVDIYVVDSGINLDHNEFVQGRAIWGMTADSHISEGHKDYSGHGTHVASIAMGRVAGVAQQAVAYAVKVLGRDGTGSGSDFLQGLTWIMNRIKQQRAEGKSRSSVINMSLGFDGGYDAIDEVVREAIRQGTAVIVASGNENANACDSSPARVSEAITVGATDANDVFASYSNFGDCVNILAPGTAILAAGIESPSDGAYKSGTSMSTPFVSGVTARYLSSLNQTLDPTPDHVRDHLLTTATNGVIYELKRGTPNRLVYRECVNDTVTTYTPTYRASTAYPNRAAWHVLCLWVGASFSLTSLCN